MCLGQAAVRDFSYFRVIEKVTLYARRMENNLIKTMKELKRLQLERQAETQRVAAIERTAVSEVDGLGQENVDCTHPLHSLRSFSGCHPTPACGRKSEARNSKLAPSEAEGSEPGEAQVDAGELKKRSQCAAAQIDGISCVATDYDAGSRRGPGENKADQSGFEPARRAGRAGKGKIGAASPAS